MDHFTALPDELLLEIFNHRDLNLKDIVQLSLVCRRFEGISKSRKIWQRLYQDRWPCSLPASFHKLQFSPSFPNLFDWRQEYRTRYPLNQLVANKLVATSEHLWHLETVTPGAFTNFPREFGCTDHADMHNFLTFELQKMIFPSELPYDLTQIYYAKRALSFMRRKKLKAVWNKFNESNEKYPLLFAAMFMHDWFHTTLGSCAEMINKHLNAIAAKIFYNLSIINPQHPVILKGAENFINCEETLKPSECKVVLQSISEVIFETEKFQLGENCFILEVLASKEGSEVIIGIIYATLAARFGVVCHPRVFGQRFLLKVNAITSNEAESADTYILIGEKGMVKNFCTLESLAVYALEDPLNETPAFTTTEVLLFIANLLYRDPTIDKDGLLEFFTILKPKDLYFKRKLLERYQHSRTESFRMGYLLQEITALDRDNPVRNSMHENVQMMRSLLLGHIVPPPVTTRFPQVKFAVGMLMTHKKYLYRCVIYGWDEICRMNEVWKSKMNVNALEFKDKQPFYRVFADDSSTRYAAQENLIFDSIEMPIQHDEIGRCFENFCGNYYYPNSALRKGYPEDLNVLYNHYGDKVVTDILK